MALSGVPCLTKRCFPIFSSPQNLQVRLVNQGKNNHEEESDSSLDLSF